MSAMNCTAIVVAARLADSWAGEFEDGLLNEGQIRAQVAAYLHRSGFRSQRMLDDVYGRTMEGIRRRIADVA